MAKTASSNTRLGWAKPRREEEFRKLSGAIDLPTYRVVFQGKTRDFPILRVPIELPKYRLANGRTASSQEEHLAKHPGARKDLFSGDPELLDAQETQHKLLLDLSKAADLFDHFKIPANRQVEPILLDELGFIVNGNRRLAAWRHLLELDHGAYSHFEHVDVVVLPHCDEKDIDKLEARLQIEQDIKADYTWDAQANMILQKRKRDGFSDKQLGELYGMKESETRELIDMRNYAAEYLRSRGKENHWSLVSDQEYAFRKLVVLRSRIKSAGEQELFKHAAYALIDKPGEVGGRLYEVIPRLQEYLGQVKSKLQARYAVKPPKKDDGLADLLGADTNTDADPIDMPLAAVIQKQENSEEVRKIITEAIESERQIVRDAKAANYLLQTLGRVNSMLQAAVRDGLRSDSNKEGIDMQLQTIRKMVDRIEKWLS